MPDLTPFQTVGPYFALIPGVESPDPAERDPGTGAAEAAGEAVEIVGAVRDGTGAPVPDALLEAWHPDLSRIVRAPTGPDGTFRIRVAQPRSRNEAGQAAPLAPCLVVGVLARGVLTRLVTRIYFAGHPDNATDPILALVPADRRATLIAVGNGPNRYRHDIALQGPAETVFFDV